MGLESNMGRWGSFFVKRGVKFSLLSFELHHCNFSSAVQALGILEYYVTSLVCKSCFSCGITDDLQVGYKSLIWVWGEFLGGCFENGTLHPAGVPFFHMAFFFLLKRKLNWVFAFGLHKLYLSMGNNIATCKDHG
jgi:hypothetical protein